MAIRAILFDKDDTIVDLPSFWRKPVEKLAVFVARSCDREEDTILKEELESASGFDSGILRTDSPVVWGTDWDVARACVQVLANRGISVEEETVEEWVQYLEYACNRYGSVVGKTNFQTLLPKLKEGGFMMGIATSDHYSTTMHCLKALGIDSYFDVVLAADQVEHAKPAPDMAEIFCRRCDVKPEETLMVGDSENDMRFAKNSGLVGIYYHPSPVQVQPDGAAVVLHDLQDLPECIQSLKITDLPAKYLE